RGHRGTLGLDSSEAGVAFVAAIADCCRGARDWPTRNRVLDQSKRYVHRSAAAGDRSVHDAVHGSALEIYDVDLAGGILTERADLDGLEPQLDAPPTRVGPAHARDHPARAPATKEILAD